MTKTKTKARGVEQIEVGEELLAAIEECGKVVSRGPTGSYDLTRVYLDHEHGAVVGTDGVRMHVVPMEVPERAGGRLVYPRTWQAGARQVVVPDCCLTDGNGVVLPLGDGHFPEWRKGVPKRAAIRGDPHLALYAEELQRVLKPGSPVQRALGEQAQKRSGYVAGADPVQALVLTSVGMQVEFRVPLERRGAGSPVDVMDTVTHCGAPSFEFVIQPRFLHDILSTPSLTHEGLLRFWYCPTDPIPDYGPGPRVYLRGCPHGPYHVVMGMGKG